MTNTSVASSHNVTSDRSSRRRMNRGQGFRPLIERPIWSRSHAEAWLRHLGVGVRRPLLGQPTFEAAWTNICPSALE